jgi:para-nitrobenzyl esterase
MMRHSKIPFLVLSLLVVAVTVAGCTSTPATPILSAPPTTPPLIQTSEPTPAPIPTTALSPSPTTVPIPKSTPTLPQAPTSTPTLTPSVTARPFADPVKIDSGLVSGTMGGNGLVHIYRGIPYAAPPVGDLRWKPPQPVNPWTGVRQCIRFGSAGLQPSTNGSFQGSEDCLYLNVYTPAKMASDRLPVMVWFPGGSNISGAAALYDGTLLAQQGVVVVTVNYRLGPLGWLAHPLLSKESPNKVSGNYGLLDDVASLKWVQTNIAGFAGDAGNVTIFGESAGGCAVINLMASPLAKGLFQRAIVQSGLHTFTQSSVDAEKQGESLAARLGVSGAPDVLKALRAKSAEEIVAEGGKSLGKLWNEGGTKDFRPAAVVDGWFLPDSPEKIFRDGNQQNVPLIIGLNSGDTTDFFGSASMLAGYMSVAQPNVYVYEFTRVPPGWSKAGIPALHGFELDYLFGTIDQIDAWGKNMTGVSPEVDPVVDGKVSKEMMALWTQFAATGDPSVKGTVSWLPYDLNSQQYLDIGETLQVKSGFSKVTPIPFPTNK